MELSHRSPVVHGIKGSHLVDTHRRHLEQSRHFIHDADRSKAMLTLTKIENGHDGSLLVLRGVFLENLCDDGLILLVELEGNIGVVVRCIAML